MAIGKVKWFNIRKGFGFIQPEDGSSDIFVHVSVLQRTGLAELKEGQRITYDRATNKGKIAAANIKLIASDVA